MNIGLNANVDCLDGHCGHSTGIVVDRSTRRLTHIVVKESGFRSAERLVPTRAISWADRQKVNLSITKEEFSELEHYKVNVSSADQRTVKGGGSSPETMWEFIPPVPDQLIQGGQKVNLSDFDTSVSHENIEEDEASAGANTRVEAVNGYVGWLVELVVDPDTMNVTGIVMRTGQLWGQRDVVVPVEDIDYVRRGVIHLGLYKQQIKELPGASV
jgi:hypothetical protein